MDPPGPARSWITDGRRMLWKDHFERLWHRVADRVCVVGLCLRVVFGMELQTINVWCVVIVCDCVWYRVADKVCFVMVCLCFVFGMELRIIYIYIYIYIYIICVYARSTYMHVYRMSLIHRHAKEYLHCRRAGYHISVCMHVCVYVCMRQQLACVQIRDYVHSQACT